MLTENALIESPSLRDEFINRTEVLDKVKALSMLPDDLHVTIPMAASYYEVADGTIKALLSRNADEFADDNIIVLKGSELKDFRCQLQDATNIPKKAPSLTLLTRKALLRIGMLLQDSEVAHQVRNYLLKVEQVIPKEARILIADGQMDQIRSMIQAAVSAEISKYLPLRTYVNASSKFEDLIRDFHKYTTGIIPGPAHCYKMFYQEFRKWLGNRFASYEYILNEYGGNTKQYILNNHIDDMEEFINGIRLGTTIKTPAGYWTDKNGIFRNDIEWPRILDEFSHSCAYCGSHLPDDKLEKEHIIHKRAPGTSDMAFNLIPSCSICNKAKDENPFEIWYPQYQFYSPGRHQAIINHIRRYSPEQLN